jgi:hypothetical protein
LTKHYNGPPKTTVPMPGRTLRRGISLSSAAQGVGLRFGTTSLNSKNLSMPV